MSYKQIIDTKINILRKILESETTLSKYYNNIEYNDKVSTHINNILNKALLTNILPYVIYYITNNTYIKLYGNRTGDTAEKPAYKIIEISDADQGSKYVNFENIIATYSEYYMYGNVNVYYRERKYKTAKLTINNNEISGTVELILESCELDDDKNMSYVSPSYKPINRVKYVRTGIIRTFEELETWLQINL